MSTEIDTPEAGAADPVPPSPAASVDPAVVSVVITAGSPPGKRHRRLTAALAVAIVLAIIGAMTLAGIRLRAVALGLDLSGRIPDLDASDLIAMMRPGSGVLEIGRLVDTHNPYAVIHVPPLTAAQQDAGRRLYGEQCAQCHAPNGSGGPGAPALVARTLAHGETPWAIHRSIRDGVPGTGMPPHPLSRRQLWELVAYVTSLRVPADSARLPADEAAKLATVNVPYEELAGTAYAANDWLTYGGSYGADRFSTLDEINTRNVSKLALRWLYPFPGSQWRIESSPLESNGVVYVTGPAGQVMALDAFTGTQLWEHDHPFRLVGGGEGPLGQNRGVALLGKRVFVGTWDSTLTALSAATGKVLWERRVGPYPGTYISSAPLVFGNLVVVGVGSPTNQGREFLAAYDARTGQPRWRFNTIPGPGQPGHDTWAGDSWRTGGVGPWMTGSYDPATDVLYWGTGNPRPDFDASTRAGSNLYSDCIVALRGTTGQLLWYFQSTPGDTHDWDATQVPMIADRMVGGHEDRRVLWANRNGFYYVIDRLTGAFMHGVPFARENWASGLDTRGQPILARMSRSLKGQVVFPSARGATNWWPPSYDPDLGLTFIPVLEQGMTFFPTTKTLPSSELSFFSAVRAVDSYSGKLVWEHRERERTGDSTVSGMLSTRGGLVFAAADGQFFALDARSGKSLWSSGIGGTTYAAPVTFAVSGRQFVSVVIGRSLLTFALSPGASADGMKPAGAALHAQAHSNSRAPLPLSRMQRLFRSAAACDRGEPGQPGHGEVRPGSPSGGVRPH